MHLQVEIKWENVHEVLSMVDSNNINIIMKMTVSTIFFSLLCHFISVLMILFYSVWVKELHTGGKYGLIFLLLTV